MPEIQHFTYRPLGPNSIRLFRCYKSTSNSLSGRLEVFTLDKCPAYYALSYCWSTPNRNIPIDVDSSILYTNLNLSKALSRLHEFTTESKESANPSSWIWIDQLCINQEDLVERSGQVRLMGSIYRQSMGTLIWLGDNYESSSKAWNLIHKIYTFFRKENPTAQTLADIPFKMYSDTDFMASELPEWGHAEWDHLRRLFENPWFTRTWVIQEVALSRRDPIIFHGPYRYPWYKISWAAAWLRRSGYLRLAHIPDQLLNVDAMSCIRRSQNPWPLDALLCLTSIKFQATDQRDKVYGLLGLASETQNLTHEFDALYPDYQLDVIEVYRRVTLFLVKRYSNLSILTRTSVSGEGLIQSQCKYSWDQMPSWVANWSDFIVTESQVAKPLSWLFHCRKTDIGSLGFPEHYNASGGLPVQPHESTDTSALRLSGIWVDTVTNTVQFSGPNETDTENKITYPTLRLFKIAAPLLSGCDTKKWIASFIKTTTAEHHMLGGWTDEQILKDGSAYLLNILSSNEDLVTDFITPARASEFLDLLRNQSIGANPDTFPALSHNFCFQRSFFVTSKGRMGIGPPATRFGDDVAILFGGGVPYILRKEGNSSMFIGESYIHGLMKGEEVQSLQRVRVPDIIELK